MARPLRIEFPGALYYIASRGGRREAIYEDDADREAFLNILTETVERYHWLSHAYCLMSNHYHLVIEKTEGNLSQGMRHLNGVYTQRSNRRHRRAGHLFQGRFKGILVDKENYLLELSRYVVFNPVRAGMVAAPEDWPWSSYRAMLGMAAVPKGLAVDALLSQFGTVREQARHRYRDFVLEGGEQSLWQELRQQIFLGDKAFVERMQSRAKMTGDRLNVPQTQRRRPAPSLAEIANHQEGRNAAIVAAYATGAYRYREIAAYFGVHLATVGRIVRKAMLQCEN